MVCIHLLPGPCWWVCMSSHHAAAWTLSTRPISVTTRCSAPRKPFQSKGKVTLLPWYSGPPISVFIILSHPKSRQVHTWLWLGRVSGEDGQALTSQRPCRCVGTGDISIAWRAGDSRNIPAVSLPHSLAPHMADMSPRLCCYPQHCRLRGRGWSEGAWSRGVEIKYPVFNS